VGGVENSGGVRAEPVLIGVCIDKSAECGAKVSPVSLVNPR